MNSTPKILEDIVAALVDKVTPDIDKAYADIYFTDEKVFKYKNSINFKKLDTTSFFKNFELKLTLVKDKKPSYRGVYDDKLSLNKGLLNGWKISPKIMAKIYAKNATVAKKLFVTCLEHELAHAYMDFCYVKQNNKNPYDVRMFRNRGRYIYDAVVRNERLADVFYLLHKPERNAYLAQLEIELSQKKDRIKNKKSLIQALETTIPYKHYKYLNKTIAYLTNETDVKYQYLFMQATEKIMGKHFNNYSQYKKYMLGRWRKWEKAFLTKSSKIAYNVYEKIMIDCKK